MRLVCWHLTWLTIFFFCLFGIILIFKLVAQEHQENPKTVRDLLTPSRDLLTPS